MKKTNGNEASPAMSWSFAGVWNDTIENGKSEREVKPRQNIWASEIGGSMIDRYLKMSGQAPTNPPNARSRRKFEAGNIWECIVGYVLRRAGILQESQEWLKYEYPGLLPVTGKLDFMAGGTPDYDKALNAVDEMNWLPEFVKRATTNIVNSLKASHPHDLKSIVLEIKSCSSFMFEVYERKGVASTQHQCQAFHYLKAKNMKEAHIVYICRDDARILEMGIFNPSPVEAIYRSDIEAISTYISAQNWPPLEKCLIFDEQMGKFSANWKVAYSQYLTMLYGFKDQSEFDDAYKSKAESWNRVLARIIQGEKMTDNNKGKMDEMIKAGFDVQEIQKKLVSREPIF